MTIGIASPFSPQLFVKYLPGTKEKVPVGQTAATAVHNITRAFLELGHKVMVFTSSAEVQEVTRLEGKKLTIIIVPQTWNHIGKGVLFSWYVGNRIKNEIAKEIESLDVLHAQWTYEYSFASKSFSKQIPVYCTVRDWCPYILSIQDGVRNKLSWLSRYFMFQLVMRNKKVHFLANSSYTEQQIAKTFPKNKVTTIPNSIDKDVILTESISKKESRFISICQALGEKRKNIETLLLAFKEYRKTYPTSTLALVGQDDIELHKRWDTLGLTINVEFLGRCSHKALLHEMDKSTCLVHPSLEETFGNILLEGMARRIPCLGGINSGAVPKVLGNGKYGVLCDVSNYHEICKAMIHLSQKEIANNIINVATDYLTRNYSNHMIAQQHLDLYNNRQLS